MPGAKSQQTLYCSFCGKSHYEVAKLIAGPTVFICNECVALCTEIIHEEAGPPLSLSVKVTHNDLTTYGFYTGRGSLKL